MRLIDANALMKRICWHECGMHPEDCDGMESETVPCNFHAYVSEAPAVDAIPREKWNELKETIIEMRDSGGTATQKDVCKFLTNLMEILDKEGKNEVCAITVKTKYQTMQTLYVTLMAEYFTLIAICDILRRLQNETNSKTP